MMPVYPDVHTLPKIPFDSVVFLDMGESVFNVCRALHCELLMTWYGDDIPDPQAAVQDDGTLVLFWEKDGWPVCVRVDDELWTQK